MLREKGIFFTNKKKKNKVKNMFDFTFSFISFDTDKIRK